MIIFLNLSSLTFGITAWILPLINILKYKKCDKWYVLSISSISFCALSIFFQLYYQNYLVKIDDLPALMDTIGASAFLSAVLLLITIILNAINMILFLQKD
jgi:cytochrome c oxidase subunit 4